MDTSPDTIPSHRWKCYVYMTDTNISIEHGVKHGPLETEPDHRYDAKSIINANSPVTYPNVHDSTFYYSTFLIVILATHYSVSKKNRNIKSKAIEPWGWVITGNGNVRSYLSHMAEKQLIFKN